MNTLEVMPNSEIVELGYWIGFTFGGQRWLKTLSTRQGEFEASIVERKTIAKNTA
jgi:hypothetical protein